jgi:hypothetical protein
MTDSRLPDQWLGNPDFDDMNDMTWRVFTGGLMWSNRNGTDGRIPKRYLRQLHPDGDHEEAATWLVTNGYWIDQNDAVQFVDWVGLGQSLAADVQRLRERKRVNQAEKRRRDKSHVTGDVTGDEVGDVGEARRGEDVIEIIENSISHNPAITAVHLSWAKDHVPDVDLDSETKAFTGFNVGKSLTNWDAAWRGWMQKKQREIQSQLVQIDASRLARENRLARSRAEIDGFAALRDTAAPAPQCAHGLTFYKCRDTQCLSGSLGEVS